MLKAFSLIIFGLISFACVRESETPAATWPQFRGLKSFGLLDESAKAPVQFGLNYNLLWQVALPAGHSTPCIWGNNLFVTAYIKDEKALQTICINYKGRVYMIKNGGIITCVDVERGRLVYLERSGESGPYLSSPFTVNGNTYIPFNNSVITVINAGDKLEILAQNNLEENMYSTPAVMGNTLYVRTMENLYALANNSIILRKGGRSSFRM